MCVALLSFLRPLIAPLICLQPGTRAIVWLDIHAVTTACGFSVPIYEHIRHRDTVR